MKRNVLIIEDNKTCRDALAEMTQKCDTVGAVFCADNSADAYKYAMEEEIDLFLVDIILDTSNNHDVSGIVIVDKLRKMKRYEFTPVIFITSLVDQALNALHNLHCYDYIEKPFDFDNVKKIIETALNIPLGNDNESELFYYRKDGVLYSLNVDRMICVETSFRNVRICTLDEDISLPYMPFKKISNDLPRKYFVQCSRNTMVNKRFIKYVDKANCLVKLKNGMMVKIGAKMKKGFMDEL